MDTTTSITIRPAPSLAAMTVPAPMSAAQLLELWKRSQDSERTRRTYEAGVKSFAAYVNAPSPEAAVELMLAMDAGSANALAEGWRAELRDRRSPATVNARLTSIRSLCLAARRFGVTSWELEVDNVDARAYRDTRGPGAEAYARMRDAARRGDTPKAKRDYAALRLLHDLGLRSAELLALRIEDVDLRGGRVHVMGKGRHQREALSLPDGTRNALAEWLVVRGDAPGYAFCRQDRAGRGSCGRLNAKSLYRLVSKYGRDAGVRVSPHKLRHESISRAAERTGGDLVRVAAHSRHKSLNTVRIYVDQLRDEALGVARLVAGD